MNPYRILIVDDEAGVIGALKRMIRFTPCVCDGRSFPLEAETFTSPLEALERARHTAFDLFLADYRMPGMNGVEFLKAVRELQPEAVRLILSGFADLNALIAAINEAQIYRFISKPWSDYDLITTIGQALAYRELMAENQRLADERRVERSVMTPQELEMKRLEALEPGITRVNWGPDGSVLLDPGLLDATDD